MKMLRKVNDSASLEISQENVYDANSFSKVASLLCSDCSLVIKRTRNRLFMEYVSKSSCLRKNKKRKSLFFEEIIR